MAVVRPFRSLHPASDAAARVASVPYDVVSTDEARELASGNPLSFLHVSRAEIDLPEEVDPYSERVYEQAVKNFDRIRHDAPMVQEERESVYCYRLRDGDHQQIGVAATFSLDEYDRNIVRKHELTRPDKESDRTRHVLAVKAQTGITFLTYRASEALEAIAHRVSLSEPLIDFTASDGVSHTIWRMASEDQAQTVEAFNRVPVLYIADGHHRIASAARARETLAAGGGESHSAAQYFLAVAFPDAQTRILPYNRVVTDLAGLTPSEFLARVRERLPLRAGGNTSPQRGRVAVYLDGTWYTADLRAVVGQTDSEGVASGLDVALLHTHLLEPVLRIVDERTDPRIAFVGGIRGVGALERLVDRGDAAVAFSMAPVSPADLMAVSDAGEIMPPKSTWFEPKLRDGLLVHLV